MSPDASHPDPTEPTAPPVASAAALHTSGKRTNWRDRGRTLAVGIGLGLVLAFIGSRLLAPRSAAESSGSETVAASAAGAAQTVTVAEAAVANVQQILEATGTADAYELLPVTPQTAGLRIEQILVDEGDAVRAGQVLARFDSTVLQAQRQQALAGVQQAEARLAELRAGARSEERARAQEAVRSAEAGVAQARSDLDLLNKRLERNELLQAEGAIAQDRLDEVRNQQRTAQAGLEQAQARLQDARATRQELQSGARPEAIAQAEAELAQAKAQVRLLDAQLRDTRLLAPRAGLVATRTARLGATTSTSEPLFELIQDGRLEVQLSVPETQLEQIRVGQPVQVRSDANPDLTATGRVRDIDPLVDAESRQALVKVDIPSRSLRPGMFVRAEIVVNTAAGVTVPVEAVLPQSDGSARVFVLQADNTAIATPIEMGELLADERVEIRSGLSPGDRVAVKGAPYLNDGDRVEISDDDSFTAPASDS